MAVNHDLRDRLPADASRGAMGDAYQLARALDGDTAALGRVVAAHWSAVASFAARLLHHDRDAGEDVAQDVFLRLAGRELHWSASGTPRAFLLGVARHLCLNRRRRRSIRQRLTARARSALLTSRRSVTPADALDEAELDRAVEAILGRMPERRREAFLLVRAHGLSYAEAARVMEVSPQTVANQVSAALRDLRRIL